MNFPPNRSTRVTALTSLLALLAAASPFKNSGSQIEFFPSRGLSVKECFGAGSNSPEALEPGGLKRGIANRVLDVLMAQIGLQRPRIV